MAGENVVEEAVIKFEADFSQAQRELIAKRRWWEAQKIRLSVTIDEKGFKEGLAVTKRWEGIKRRGADAEQAFGKMQARAEEMNKKRIANTRKLAKAQALAVEDLKDNIKDAERLLDGHGKHIIETNKRLIKENAKYRRAIRRREKGTFRDDPLRNLKNEETIRKILGAATRKAGLDEAKFNSALHSTEVELDQLNYDLVEHHKILGDVHEQLLKTNKVYADAFNRTDFEDELDARKNQLFLARELNKALDKRVVSDERAAAASKRSAAATKRYNDAVRHQRDEIANLNRAGFKYRNNLRGIDQMLIATNKHVATAFSRRGTFGGNELEAGKNELVILRERKKVTDKFDADNDRRRKRAESVSRRSKSLFGNLFKGGDGGFGKAASGMADFIDTGGKGIRPMNALILGVVALSPALLAMASSAAYASTSLVALAPAALGAVTAFAALGVAFKGLIGAFKLLDQAQKGSDAALAELEDRLGRMSPIAQTLFGQVLALKNGFALFSRAVETVTLPGFVSALASIQDDGKEGVSTLDHISRSIINMGDAISGATAKAGAFFGSSIFKGALVKIIDNNQKAFQSLNRAVVALLEPITRIFAGASPLVARFGTYLEKVANKFNDLIGRVSDSRIEDFFRGAGDELAKWWRIATNLGGALFNIMSASLPGGSTLVDRLERFTKAIKDWTATNTDKFKEFFDWLSHIDYIKIGQGLTVIAGGVLAIKSAAAIGGALKALTNPITLILAGLFAIGAAATLAYQKVKPFRDLVNETIGVLQRMWDVIWTKVKPALDEAFVKVGEAIKRNKPAFDSMLKFFEGLAPIIGDVLVVAIQYMTTVFTDFIDRVAWGYKAFLTFEIALTEILGRVIRLIGFLDKIVTDFLIGLVKKASGILHLLPDAGSQLMAKAFDKVAEKFENGAHFLEDSIDNAGKFLAEAKANAEELLQAANRATVPAGTQVVPGGVTSIQPERLKVRAGTGKATVGKITLDPSAARAAAQEATDRAKQAREALKSAQDELQNARDRLLDAREELAKGQRDQVKAQRELSEERVEAIKHLKDLRLQVQGLAADEADARLKLTYAKEHLKSFEFTNAVDPLIRRSMENDVLQAQNDLNQTLADGKEKRDELAKAEKDGIENAPEVLRAKERLLEVNIAQVKNLRDLRRAETDVQDATAKVATAQAGLRIATNGAVAAVDRLNALIGKSTVTQNGYKTAIDGTTGAVGRLQAALIKLPANKNLTLTVKPQVYEPGAAKAIEGRLSIIDIQAMNKKALTTRAKGGPINGPGGPTGDKVPALLSAGEYVTNTAATRYYGSRNMAKLNSREIPRAALEQFGYDRPRYATGGYVWPLPGHHAISSHFGVDRGSYSHGGNDYPAPLGTPIVATAAGRVIQSGWYGGGGNTVSLSHAGNLVSRYMHMSQILASLGAAVKAGQRIGLVGSTGDSTGPHLHFQTERPPGNKINPDGVLSGAPDRGPVPGGGAGAPAAKMVLSALAERIVATLSANQYSKQIATQLANALGARLPVPELSKTFVLPTGVMDQGGIVPPGPFLGLNRTGKPERLTNTTNGHTIRLDKRDIQLLASMLAVASAQRPIQMDGVSVAKQVSAQQYVPLGV